MKKSQILHNMLVKVSALKTQIMYFLPKQLLSLAEGPGITLWPHLTLLQKKFIKMPPNFLLKQMGGRRHCTGFAFFVCVMGVRFIDNAFSMTLSVLKTYSIATDGETHTQNEHKNRKCNRPLKGSACFYKSGCLCHFCHYHVSAVSIRSFSCLTPLKSSYSTNYDRT
jgi:hypothetical protein